MNFRGVNFSFEAFESLEGQRKNLISKTQSFQERRNSLAREIGFRKADGGDVKNLIEESENIKLMLPALEERLREHEIRIADILLQIPNILSEDVPEGKSEDENIEIKKFLEIPNFDFAPKQHFEIGEKMKFKDFSLMDFETAAKISGSRFVILHEKLAKLERALINFCLDENAAFGYSETTIPFLVRPHSFVGTGQLPKFEGDFFKTKDHYFLIPTAEVSLTNIVRESIILERELPLRFTSVSPCFRSEAGSAGKDTRGLMRNHQFMKVELVTICSPETAEKEHERILETAENILRKLNLPFRVMLLCAGDTSFTASKTYDIEVWMPGQHKYREISSISNMDIFQGRRMDAKFKRAETHKNEFVNTLNGSSMAIGRLIAAILENFQTIDGSVNIPENLIKYTGFDVIR